MKRREWTRQDFSVKLPDMRLFLIAILCLPGLALAQDTDRFCVENASQHAHLFTTETREGTRQTATLFPGGQLCSGPSAAADGIIGVFETPDALEGCGRIIANGTNETLIKYAEFDRCHWGAHDR